MSQVLKSGQEDLADRLADGRLEVRAAIADYVRRVVNEFV